MSGGVLIRRLTPRDATAFRVIRLEALDRHPESFGATYAEENVQPLDFFAGRLESSVVFGAWAEAGLVGVAGIYFDPALGPDTGNLWTIYVRHGQRRTGLARQLIEALIEDVRPRVSRLRLTVNSENQPALRLYEQLGFAACGINKNALERGGRFYDEVLMERKA
ncbi:MAG TPA: N-acetyltransferase [Magnetospirillaceae bacterium]